MRIDISAFWGIAASAAVVLTALAAVSCSRELKTSHFEMQKAVALRDGCQDSVRIEVDIEYPVSGFCGEKLQAFYDSVKYAALSEAALWTEFTRNFDGLSIEETVNEWAESTIADYKDFNLPLLEEMKDEEPGFESTLNYAYQLYSCFTTQYKDLRTYSTSFYCYTGGAHGGAFEQHTVFDMKSGKVVREADLFVPGYWETLSVLLRQHLHDAVEDEGAYESLFVKDIEPNGNFRVDSDGVTYVYGQYEIAAYAYGIIEVSVPWGELDGIVAEKYKK